MFISSYPAFLLLSLKNSVGGFVYRMKKMILKVDLHNAKDKRKAMKTVSTEKGIDLIATDMKEKKMTVVGTVDPISIVTKLRKRWHTEIVLVGPAKEEKKEEPKKEEPKKEESKKEQPKKDDEAKKKEECEKTKARLHEEMIHELLNGYRANPYTTRYYVQSIEDNPNNCVIS